ncbi:hypothetical protein DICA2_B12750 [Diutina catenulata]
MYIASTAVRGTASAASVVVWGRLAVAHGCAVDFYRVDPGFVPEASVRVSAPVRSMAAGADEVVVHCQDMSVWRVTRAGGSVVATKEATLDAKGQQLTVDNRACAVVSREWVVLHTFQGTVQVCRGSQWTTQSLGSVVVRDMVAVDSQVLAVCYRDFSYQWSMRLYRVAPWALVHQYHQFDEPPGCMVAMAGGVLVVSTLRIFFFATSDFVELLDSDSSTSVRDRVVTKDIARMNLYKHSFRTAAVVDDRVVVVADTGATFVVRMEHECVGNTTRVFGITVVPVGESAVPGEVHHLSGATFVVTSAMGNRVVRLGKHMSTVAQMAGTPPVIDMCVGHHGIYTAQGGLDACEVRRLRHDPGLREVYSMECAKGAQFGGVAQLGGVAQFEGGVAQFNDGVVVGDRVFRLGEPGEKVYDVVAANHDIVVSRHSVKHRGQQVHTGTFTAAKVTPAHYMVEEHGWRVFDHHHTLVGEHPPGFADLCDGPDGPVVVVGDDTTLSVNGAARTVQQVLDVAVVCPAGKPIVMVAHPDSISQFTVGASRDAETPIPFGMRLKSNGTMVAGYTPDLLYVFVYDADSKMMVPTVTEYRDIEGVVFDAHLSVVAGGRLRGYTVAPTLNKITSLAYNYLVLKVLVVDEYVVALSQERVFTDREARHVFRLHLLREMVEVDAKEVAGPVSDIATTDAGFMSLGPTIVEYTAEDDEIVVGASSAIAGIERPKLSLNFVHRLALTYLVGGNAVFQIDADWRYVGDTMSQTPVYCVDAAGTDDVLVYADLKQGLFHDGQPVSMDYPPQLVSAVAALADDDGVQFFCGDALGNLMVCEYDDGFTQVAALNVGSQINCVVASAHGCVVGTVDGSIVRVLKSDEASYKKLSSLKTTRSPLKMLSREDGEPFGALFLDEAIAKDKHRAVTERAWFNYLVEN